MNFKRIGGRKPFGVQLNKAEQRLWDEEINRQIIEHDLQFDMDKESAILWMLHIHFGFGAKRLKKAWELFYAETLNLRRYYQMEQKDDGWLARQELKDIGCDVEEWYKEYESNNGSNTYAPYFLQTIQNGSIEKSWTSVWDVLEHMTC